MYSNVYLHKTTRSAEKMLGALLTLLSGALKEGKADAWQLPKAHPMIQYMGHEHPTLAQYLALDDTAIWSLLPILAANADGTVGSLAARLIGRELYKCVDVGIRLSSPGGDQLIRFKKALNDHRKEICPEPQSLLIDEPRVTGYDWYSWGDESALKKVLIHGREQSGNYDIGDRSDVVRALRQRQFYRVYVPDRERQQKVYKLWEGIAP